MMSIMGKRFTNRGVSVIIAALLLIAIAVAAAVLLYVFSIGLLGSLQGSGGQQTKQQLIMEAYNWVAGGSLTLQLRNVGSASINVLKSDFFINGVTNAATGCTTLDPGGVATSFCTAIILAPTIGAAPAAPSPGVAYVVKIVTPDGAVFSYSAIDGQAS